MTFENVCFHLQLGILTTTVRMTFSLKSQVSFAKEPYKRDILD